MCWSNEAVMKIINGANGPRLKHLARMVMVRAPGWPFAACDDIHDDEVTEMLIQLIGGDIAGGWLDLGPKEEGDPEWEAALEQLAIQDMLLYILDPYPHFVRVALERTD